MGFAWVVFFAIIGNRPYCLLVVLFVSRVTSPFALGPSSALFCPQPQPIKPLPPKPTRKPRQSAKPTSTTATTPPLATLTTNNVDNVNRGVDGRVTDDPFEGGFVAQDTGVDLEAAARRRVSWWFFILFQQYDVAIKPNEEIWSPNPLCPPSPCLRPAG